MSSDADVALRPDALAILREVLASRAAAAERASRDANDGCVSLATEEQWALSQFWYDEATATSLATEVLTLAAQRHAATGGDVTVAFVSSPSAFKALRAAGPPPYVRPWLLEFDDRFAVFGAAFVHYDFNDALALPAALLGACDILLLDPPFLAPACLAEFARTAAALRRGGPADSRLLLCTGAVMLPHARRLLGARPTRLHVGHANRLSNPFALFVDYLDADDGAAGRLGGVDAEAEAAEERQSSDGAAEP